MSHSNNTDPRPVSPTPHTTAPGKKLGQGMLILCMVLGLGGLTLFFNDRLNNQINPNQNPDSFESASGVREVILQRSSRGHYVANGTINGIAVTFLLDTGATDVAIPAEIALAANLARGTRGRASTANGIVDVYSTVIDELVLGNIVLKQISASITTSMQDNTILLGMSALKHVEFSQRGRTLTLRQHP